MTLTLLFDFQTYLGFIGQHLDFFLNEGGSGVGERGPNNLDFFWHKITITREISALSSDTLGFIVFLIVLLGGPLLIWRFFRNEVQRNIVTLLWSGWLAHSLWFVLLSKGGWVRHNWHALMLAVLLLSLITAHAWQSINRPPQWINRVTALFLAGVLLIGFAHQTEAATFFISDRLVERWYQDQLAADHTRIPWGLVPRDAQENVLDFLEQLPASARIFYPEGHKSAEMAVMSGRVLYPIERRPYMPPAKGDVALIGPSLISRWRKPNETHVTQAQQQAFVAEVLKQVKRECPEILFENDYYIICGLD